MSEEKVVFYTDGGCKPSRGRGGWGVHGSIGDLTFDTWGSFKEDTTNNAAEVVAATKALTLAAEKGVKDLTIKTDSEYTLKGAEKYVRVWEKNNWCRNNGQPVINVDEWKELLKAEKHYRETLGGALNWVWVKGHDGDTGNEFADLNASRGVSMAINRITDECYVESPTKGYGKIKSANYNRLLFHSRGYVHDVSVGTPKSHDGRFVYMTGTHGKEDDLIGVRLTQAAHSVVFCKEPEPVLERIISHQDKLIKTGLLLPTILRLDNIFSPKTYDDILKYDVSHTRYNGKEKNIHSVDGALLTQNLTKPLKSPELFALFGDLGELLSKHIAGGLTDHAHIKTTNITNIFFGMSEAKKPKPILLKKIDSSVKYVDVLVEHGCEKKKRSFAKLRLTLGKDAPTRNALAAVAELEPTINLVTVPITEHGFRYYVIIETENDASITAASHSNILMVNDKGPTLEDFLKSIDKPLKKENEVSTTTKVKKPKKGKRNGKRSKK